MAERKEQRAKSKKQKEHSKVDGHLLEKPLRARFETTTYS
jgi:hypothetical protein